MEDHQTFSNYKGIQLANTSQALATKVKKIINVNGGAKTKISETTRREILANPEDISDLINTLNSGLEVRDDAETAGPSVPN